MTDTKRSTVVLGATGLQGGGVARALTSQGARVRAVVRDPTQQRALALRRRGVELVVGDLADPVSLSAAMQGASAVFSVQPSSGQPGAPVTDEEEVRFGELVIETAERQEVEQFVYSSAIAASHGLSGIGHFDTKVHLEERLRRSTIPLTTVVRPATFMEFLLPSKDEVAAGTVSFLMRPEQAMQVVASSDIGRVVAAVIDRPGDYQGRSVNLAGDEVTGLDLAVALSRHTGSTLRYSQLPGSLRTEVPMLGRLVDLLDAGPLAGDASLEDLRAEFPFLKDLRLWLASEGGAHGAAPADPP